VPGDRSRSPRLCEACAMSSRSRARSGKWSPRGQQVQEGLPAAADGAGVDDAVQVGRPLMPVDQRDRPRHQVVGRLPPGVLHQRVETEPRGQRAVRARVVDQCVVPAQQRRLAAARPGDDQHRVGPLPAPGDLLGPFQVADHRHRGAEQRGGRGLGHQLRPGGQQPVLLDEEQITAHGCHLRAPRADHLRVRARPPSAGGRPGRASAGCSPGSPGRWRRSRRWADRR
jgi:hypothetical protein